MLIVVVMMIIAVQSNTSIPLHKALTVYLWQIQKWKWKAWNQDPIIFSKHKTTKAKASGFQSWSLGLKVYLFFFKNPICKTLIRLQA